MIYDCFTFFNELPLLELRLKLLSPYVDKFILVEMSQTQRGEPKPYYYADNKEMFSEYNDKIICIHPENIPVMEEKRGWTLENFQRKSIIDGLGNCEPDDIIMISDLDEIPNPRILKNMDKYFVKPRWPYHFDAKFRYWKSKLRKDFSWLYKKMSVEDALEKYAVGCSLYLFHYFLNCRSTSLWSGSIIVKYKNLKYYGKLCDVAQDLRDIRSAIPYVENAGWHFSYLGGKEAVKRKLASVVDDRPAINAIMDRCQNDDAYLEKCLNMGIDLYGKMGDDYKFEFIDMKDIGVPNIEEFIKKYPHLYRT